MAQAMPIGRVVNDLELKTSVNHKAYVMFSLAERIGYGERARTQYFQVWAWGDMAQQLVKRGVTKGSLIWVSGVLELVDYTKKDGTTRDKQMKVTLRSWDFVPGTGQPNNKVGTAKGAPKAQHEEPSPEVIDGERDKLPE